MALEIVDQAIVIDYFKYQGRIITDLFTQNHGRHRAYLNANSKFNPLLGTKVEASLKLGPKYTKAKIELKSNSNILKLWNSPKPMLAFAAICELTKKLIPEGMHEKQDYILLNHYLDELTNNNYLDNLRKWESYLSAAYLTNSTAPNSSLDFIAHCRQTEWLETVSRKNLVATLILERKLNKS